MAVHLLTRAASYDYATGSSNANPPATPNALTTLSSIDYDGTTTGKLYLNSINDGGAAVNMDDAQSDAQDVGTAVVGKKYALTFSDDMIYDGYLTFADKDLDKLAITYDDATLSFTVGVMPDELTTAYTLPFTLTTVDVLGKVMTSKLEATIAPKSAAAGAIALQTIDLTKDDVTFGFDLAEAGINTSFWKYNADLSKTTATLYSDKDCESAVANYSIDNSKILNATSAASSGKSYITLLKKGGKADATSVDDAALVKLNLEGTYSGTKHLDLDTEYYVKVEFKNQGSQTIATAVVPVKFVAPAPKALFTPLSSYLNKDGVINAYFKEAASKDLTLSDYFGQLVDGEFTALDAETADATVALDNKETVTTIAGTKYTSDDLATVANAFNTATITLKTQKTSPDDLKYDAADVENGGWEREYGYGESLTVNVTMKDYKDFLYKGASGTHSFQIRLASVIMDGDVVPVGDIKLSYAALSVGDGAKILSSQIKGQDANGAKYDLFAVKDADPAYTKFGLDSTTPVTFGDGTLVTVNDEAADENAEEGVAPITTDADGNAVDGYVYYKQNTDKTVSASTPDKIAVTLKDAWGYERTFGVKVTVVVP